MHPPQQIFFLEDKYGITLPVYIHKIDRNSYWNCEDGIEQGVENALNNVFNSHDYIYSLWLITSEQDLHCVAATLNANRGSPSEEIPFIWITQKDLEQIGLSSVQVDEGKCIYAQKLHFNVTIEPSKAKELCYLLMDKIKKAARCTKKEMKLVVEVQEKRGCQAYKNHPEACNCKTS